ncbi:MAG: hypothetical protein QOE96_366 [Blastocatellia bacterium]|jgi:hypothetical protein|nr:hypothetical protein [Blastocatellia bacterium]
MHILRVSSRAGRPCHFFKTALVPEKHAYFAASFLRVTMDAEQGRSAFLEK